MHNYTHKNIPCIAITGNKLLCLNPDMGIWTPGNSRASIKKKWQGKVWYRAFSFPLFFRRQQCSVLSTPNFSLKDSYWRETGWVKMLTNVRHLVWDAGASMRDLICSQKMFIIPYSQCANILTHRNSCALPYVQKANKHRSLRSRLPLRIRLFLEMTGLISLHSPLTQCCGSGSRIRIHIGSVFNRDSGSGSVFVIRIRIHARNFDSFQVNRPSVWFRRQRRRLFKSAFFSGATQWMLGL